MAPSPPIHRLCRTASSASLYSLMHAAQASFPSGRKCDKGFGTRRRAAVFLVATLPHVKHCVSHWQRHARQPRQKEHAREKKSELAARCPQPHVHWRAASQTLQGSDLACTCIQSHACCKHETSRTFHGRPEAHIRISGTPGPQASAPHHPPWLNVASEATEAVAPAKARRRRTCRKQGQRPWAIFLSEAPTSVADKCWCHARTRLLRPR